MAFLKFGKKRKGEPLDIPLPSPDAQPIQQSSPIEQVLMMKQQGYTNNQIVQTLQSQGYEQGYQQQPSFQSFQAPKEIQPPSSIDEERIQEVAEAIIDEKWNDLVK